MENFVLKKTWRHHLQAFKNLYHLAKALIANLYYGFPSRKIKIIGVTGTDGKTTTTSLIYHILKTSGKKVSLVSTVYAKIGDKEYDTGLHTTTPDVFTVQSLVRSAVSHGDEYLVFEITSHALDQYRVFGLKPYVSVITNITHEHLDYHLSYMNYLKTKVGLLLCSGTAVVNADDESYPLVKKILDGKKQKYKTYSLAKKADFMLDFTDNGLSCLAEFNKYNYLASYAVSRLIGVEYNAIMKALATFTLPPGRLETVYDNEFRVIIDFAHTPNAISKALAAVKKQLGNKGRLIHVFGAAGLRDYSKRTSMGKTSGQYADLVILTEEDYRVEDLYKICDQISQGLLEENFKYKKSNLIEQNDIKTYTIISKRADAINKAIQIAKTGDIVILTGKAHEKSLCRGNKEHPWDEKKAVVNALKINNYLKP